MKPKPCKNCGSEWHTKWKCPLLPKQTLIPRKPMNRGTKRLRFESKKHRQKREATTAAFFLLNPPDADGMWTCYLQVVPNCLRRMTKEQVNPEHVLSKVRHQDKRYDVTNIKPACGPCNEFKGSKDYIDGKLV